MTKKERVVYIQKHLGELFPDPPVPLDHRDPFTLLVAVVLSAQCTDVRVNKVTPKLFALADTPKAMALLPVARVQAIIKPCGLSGNKAKALVGLSKLILEKHNGQIPDNFKDLEALPGVGHKTASVVMAQAFGVPAFPVDTHIHRLAQRWELTNGKNVAQTEKDLKRLFPESVWRDIHIQFILYGREYCKARTCDGLRCEICQQCFPNRKKPVKHKRA